MKSNFTTLLLMIAFLTTSSLLSAQKNFTPTLDALLDSEFIKQFQEIRTSAMASATAFKNQAVGNQQGGGYYNPESETQTAKQYSKADIKRVEEGYNKVADKFNFVLLRLKNDLLNKEKMKHIQKFPEDYERLLKYDMIELREFYAVNYQQVLSEVTNEEVDGAVLLLISDIIISTANVYQLVRSLVEYIKFNQRRAKKQRAAELEKRLIKPHTFKMWFELGKEPQNNGGYDNREMEPQAPQDILTIQQPIGQGYGGGGGGSRIPDKDGDGVADSEDACPNEYGSARGCPDTDGDGVADKFDKCPQQVGYSMNGCPDVDISNSAVAPNSSSSFPGSSSNPNSSSPNPTIPPNPTDDEIDGTSGKIKIALPKKKTQKTPKKKKNR